MEVILILKKLRKYYKNISKQVSNNIQIENKEGLKYLRERLTEIKKEALKISTILTLYIKDIEIISSNPIVTINKRKLNKTLKCQEEVNDFIIDIDTKLISIDKIISDKIKISKK